MIQFFQGTLNGLKRIMTGPRRKRRRFVIIPSSPARQ
jgi:hypothetical protein